MACANAAIEASICAADGQRRCEACVLCWLRIAAVAMDELPPKTTHRIARATGERRNVMLTPMIGTSEQASIHPTWYAFIVVPRRLGCASAPDSRNVPGSGRGMNDASLDQYPHPLSRSTWPATSSRPRASGRRTLSRVAARAVPSGSGSSQPRHLPYFPLASRDSADQTSTRMRSMLDRWASTARSSLKSGSWSAGLTCACGFVEHVVDVGGSGAIRSLGDGHGCTSHVKWARTRERERAGWAHDAPCG